MCNLIGISSIFILCQFWGREMKYKIAEAIIKKYRKDLDFDKLAIEGLMSFTTETLWKFFNDELPKHLKKCSLKDGEP